MIECGVLLLDEKGKVDKKEKIQTVNQADSFVRFRMIEKLDLEQDIMNDKSGKIFSRMLAR